MNYQECLSWIAGIERGGSNYGLERERELLDLLGSPDKDLNIVHIAGTNGKGSVCAYLTSIFVASCKTVGTYNSPSIYAYTERFNKNGEPIAGKRLAEVMTKVRDIIENEQKVREFKPTAFEIETATALQLFKEEGCDIVVLETGLGGKWDATNAIKNKLISVITTIGLDHCELLGDTLEDIAKEKSAIIKGDAVSAPEPFNIAKIIADACDENGGQFIMAGTPELIVCDIDGQVFSYKGEDYQIRMLGTHQLVNAAVAIETANALMKKGVKLNIDDIKCGLVETMWPVRFQVLNAYNQGFKFTFPQDKLLVLDGGHNPQGASVLADAIKQYLAGLKIHLVIGVLKDKDYKRMLSTILPYAERITAVTPDSPRALDANELLAEIKAQGYEGKAIENIKAAVQDALILKGTDVVILCGSLTLFKSLL